jgi:hypothetical protein
MKIITINQMPPIPTRSLDWVAYLDDYVENSEYYGYGETEAEAIEDLKEIIEENNLGE